MKVAVFVACFVALVAGNPPYQGKGKNYPSSAAYNPYPSYKNNDYKEKPYGGYGTSKYGNDGYKSSYKSDYSNKNYDYNNDYQSDNYQSYDNYQGYDNYASDYSSNGYDKNYDSQYQSDYGYGYQKGCPSLESVHVIRAKYSNNFVKYVGDTTSTTAFCGPASATTVSSFFVKCHNTCVKINHRTAGLEEELSFLCKNNKWVLLAGSEDYIPVSPYSITCAEEDDGNTIGCSSPESDLVACL